MVVQVMELLGPSLWDVWKKTEHSLSPEYAACVAVEALTILEDLHRRGSDTFHLQAHHLNPVT